MAARGEPITRDWCGTLHREGDRVVKVVTLDGAAQMLDEVRSEAKGTSPHPTIAIAREAGVDGGQLWIAIDVAPGMPLSDFLEKGHRLEAKRLLRIVATLADALAQLHEKGKAHGDVSPENVLLHPGDRVTLLDFCIPRTSGEKPAPAADQRALAASVHRLLTGNRPSSGASSLAKQRPDLPAGVPRAIAKALSQDPFATTREFSRAFSEAFLEETNLPPHEASIESGIWDVPRRERDRAEPIAPRIASPKWPRRLSIATLLGALLATWLLYRFNDRNRR